MMNNRNNNKDKNPVKRFNKISIGLASPESILKESRGEVLNQKLLTTELTNQSVTDFSAKESSDLLRILNVLVVNIKEFVTKALSVTVVVLKLQRKKYVVTE